LADGPAWILALAVVLDANSRSPVWFGLLTTTFVAFGRAPIILYGVSADNETFLLVLALMGATLIGQLIRGAFAAGRASEAAADARRLVERLELRHAVHDSGSARLAQLMLLTRALRDRPELPAELRADVDLMVDVATAGGQELRAAMQPRADEPAALAREWRRSLEVLGSAGFDVVDAAPTLPSLDGDVEREAVRVVREATSNICKHGAKGGRVVAASSVGADTMTLSWLSDHDGAGAGTAGGLGLAGMAERAKRLGGSVQSALEDGCFRLRVTLPRTADA
jgi:signal transduction histidine kinase